MRFISDIGRPWTLSELASVNRLRKKLKHEIPYIAVLMNRSVKEIEVVLT